MNKQDIIYDIRERLSAISDDRRIDARYILYLVKTARAEIFRKYLSRNISYNPVNIQQDHTVFLESGSRSLIPSLDLKCTILKSKNKIPRLIYEGSYGNWVRVRTIDIVKNTIELIEFNRAAYLTFEFNVVYAFLDSNSYLYLLTPGNHQELKYAVLSGIFYNPEEVDQYGTGTPDDTDDIPMIADLWNAIKEVVVNQIINRPQPDPINNSEPDYGERSKATNKNTEARPS